MREGAFYPPPPPPPIEPEMRKHSGYAQSYKDSAPSQHNEGGEWNNDSYQQRDGPMPRPRPRADVTDQRRTVENLHHQVDAARKQYTDEVSYDKVQRERRSSFETEGEEMKIEGVKRQAPRRRTFLGGLFRPNRPDEKKKVEADDKETFVNETRQLPDRGEAQHHHQLHSEREQSSNAPDQNFAVPPHQYRTEPSLPPPPPPPVSQQHHSNRLPQNQEVHVDTRPSLAEYTKKITTMYFHTAEDPVYGSGSVEEDVSTSDIEDEAYMHDRVGPDAAIGGGEAMPPSMFGIDVHVLRDLVREARALRDELRKIVVDGPANAPSASVKSNKDVIAIDDTFGQQSDSVSGGDIFIDEHANEEESLYDYEYEYETYDDVDNDSESNPNNKTCDIDTERIEAEIEERVRVEVAQKEAEIEARYLADKEKEIERVRAEEAEKMVKKIEAERTKAENIVRKKTAKAERIKQKRITTKRLKEERAKCERALADKDEEIERQRVQITQPRKPISTLLTRYSPDELLTMSEDELDQIIGQNGDDK